MYPQYQQPVYYGSQYSGCLKFILYALSFFVPIVGIVVGVIFMSRPDPESKSLGQTCLIIGIASMVLSCCIGLIAATPMFILPFLEGSGYY